MSIKSERIILSDGSIVYTRGPENVVQDIIIQPIDGGEAIKEVERERMGPMTAKQIQRLHNKTKDQRIKLNRQGKPMRDKRGELQIEDIDKE